MNLEYMPQCIPACIAKVAASLVSPIRTLSSRIRMTRSKGIVFTILHVLKQIREPLEHGHLIRQTQLFPFALPSPGVRNIEGPNARCGGRIDVRPGTISNHPSVRLRELMTPITS